MQKTINTSSEDQKGGFTVGQMGGDREIHVNVWKERGIGGLIVIIAEIVLVVVKHFLK